MAVAGIAGVLFTIFALTRLLAAMRAGGSRELVLGWMALMLAAAAVSLVIVRLA